MVSVFSEFKSWSNIEYSTAELTENCTKYATLTEPQAHDMIQH